MSLLLFGAFQSFKQKQQQQFAANSANLLERTFLTQLFPRMKKRHWKSKENLL